ncbi:hypothetical protein GUJ93_ZPchr0016g2616 [Zizania palustris]|uniref:Uncharacterized protein n=1 Tax=Zizania palustris TaxID=103762 RepID=A0A8J5SYY4_ZIZPA|nr:hypothetical protein GUJ93_ZPchr0016g2616 [Zizania palustris]
MAPAMSLHLPCHIATDHHSCLRLREEGVVCLDLGAMAAIGWAAMATSEILGAGVDGGELQIGRGWCDGE